MRLTLQEARVQLFDAVVPTLVGNQPGTGVPYVDLFDQQLNLACERFINSGKWLGMMREVRFETPEDYITLPRGYVSALAVRYDKDCCGIPRLIENFWYQHLLGGPGKVGDPQNFSRWGYYQNLIDLGDGWPIYRNSPYTSYYLKWVTTNPADAGKRVTAKGVDPNNNVIFTTIGGEGVDGAQTVLVNGSIQMVELFGHQPTFISKEPTLGYVQLFAVSADTATLGQQTQIGVYEPSETIISYHRYKFNGPQNLDYVSCICKVRFVWAYAPTDEIIPSNLGALRNGLQAVVYEKQGDKERYQQYFNSGLSLLNDEMKQEQGGAQFRMQIAPGSFQSARLFPGY